MKKVKTLGGSFDISGDKFTILLTEKPNRGEKYMIAMGRGCFVLHTDFIHKSHENGSFVDKDEFEFGNPKFNAGSFSQDSMFQAPYKWRQWIKVDFPERFPDGAFTGKTFIVASFSKTAQFVNIIKGGGGKHVEVNLSESFKASVIKRQNVDICLFEPNALTKENMEVLKQCKVKTHRFTYMHEFFMQPTLPE